MWEALVTARKHLLFLPFPGKSRVLWTVVLEQTMQIVERRLLLKEWPQKRVVSVTRPEMWSKWEVLRAVVVSAGITIWHCSPRVFGNWLCNCFMGARVHCGMKPVPQWGRQMACQCDTCSPTQCHTVPLWMDFPYAHGTMECCIFRKGEGFLPQASLATDSGCASCLCQHLPSMDLWTIYH